MRCIRLETVIAAPASDCFYLSLSVDAHTASLGCLADRLVLDRYMPHLLRQRNAWLKTTLEART